MKKYISLFSFIALFFVGIQQSNAQDSGKTMVKKERPETIAKQQTYELNNLLELTGEQQGAIFKVLVDAEHNKAALDGLSNDNIASAQKRKASISEFVQVKMKQILTPEQYERYTTTMLEEKEIKK